MLIYIKKSINGININDSNYKKFEKKLNELIESLKITEEKDLALIPLSEGVIKVKIGNKSAIFTNLYI